MTESGVFLCKNSYTLINMLKGAVLLIQMFHVDSRCKIKDL